MRIALFSDAHGDLPATEAVLAAIVRKQPDQIVCLGDGAMFGPQPRETLAAVKALAIIDYRSPSDTGVALRRVPVDVQSVINAAFTIGMPMADRWTADWSTQ